MPKLTLRPIHKKFTNLIEEKEHSALILELDALKRDKRLENLDKGISYNYLDPWKNIVLGASWVHWGFQTFLTSA